MHLARHTAQRIEVCARDVARAFLAWWITAIFSIITLALARFDGSWGSFGMGLIPLLAVAGAGWLTQTDRFILDAHTATLTIRRWRMFFVDKQTIALSDVVRATADGPVAAGLSIETTAPTGPKIHRLTQMRKSGLRAVTIADKINLWLANQQR